ncbi:MAG: M24 family metallopeptidase [Bifidobacterium tibiigranuli]|jgi:Xaa-Pro aminopeptidase|uniref:M24 family metallopeptidase n=1 Tax=Bifidobacterium tibiigranuli TaxID=2172043 RepID=UPI0026F23F15|nr:M24 family metallopeptidase [Bifidobacterium tibiigranuli]MCI1672886.1 M24 family metallopeptidase [Bifidobacterium tibiigranuli]MCI1713725.1 M24 family metallopeptidase [Bifidobacterium tibiigranuli]MCI1833983.1 M24 family metallopeptidase [Bifidobacterium tibiigranuli]
MALFRQEEYNHRVASVRASMAEKGFSALLVTDPCNLYYLTGYDAWSFYMPQCVYLPIEGDIYFIGREMDAKGAGYTCFLDDNHCFGYPEPLVHRRDTHPAEWIANKLKELGILQIGSTGKVGMELDEDFLTPRTYLTLVEKLPEVRFADSQELINWVRVRKSDHEIEVMKKAAAVTEHTMLTAIDAIRPGRRQCDIAADIVKAQTEGTSEAGGDYPAIVPMMPTGKAAGTPHLTWSEDLMPDQVSSTIELTGVYHRYHVPMARTVSLGKPDPDLQRVAQIVGEGMDVALSTIRPGILARDVELAWRSVTSKYGLSKPSRIGYSIGIGYPPDWGEHTVSLRLEDENVLQSGMTFHLILGIWDKQWGYELSEAIHVTESGVERFTHLPQQLTIK